MQQAQDRRAIVVIDGEHYPPVVARALDRMRARGDEPVLALMAGGVEKLGQEPVDLGVPVESPDELEAGLAEAIERTGALKVIDLSDEPVVGYVRRCRLASVAMWKGASYQGADFLFSPPDRSLIPSAPSIGVIGTGKRTGKTAIAGAAARAYQRAGLDPVVVAMGRGGPDQPEVIPAGALLDPAVLLGWVEEGRHAASDYVEDALVSGVATVGAWRAGGGLAGATLFNNYPEALEEAIKLRPGVLILEGSGAAIPPATWDAGVLAIDSGIDPGFLCGYFGLYRLLLADLVVLTMVEDSVDPDKLAELRDCIHKRPLGEPKVVYTTFRPHPMEDVAGKRVWFATTAGREAEEVLKRHLEEQHGAEVAGVSHSLGDRESLRREIESAPEVETILVELKAAAVDVVTRFALERGMEVIYVDNRAETVGGSEPLDDSLLEVAALAGERKRA